MVQQRGDGKMEGGGIYIEGVEESMSRRMVKGGIVTSSYRCEIIALLHGLATVMENLDRIPYRPKILLTYL